ncbi:GMC oxidoreductase-domain-containing protein [Tricladium varicosporioides]|nr:GMC oxidoreductase-domain-containing protein [Hymenoscyphus varicosporioides]
MSAFWSPFLVISLLFFASIDCLRIDRRDVDKKLLDCYDYIIAGGGISGLVVANRLTEDPNVTVLVVEAGDLDNYEDKTLSSIDNGDGLGTKFDWNLWTTPQKFIDGQPRPYDMGRGVGGGSLINGMCWTRGGKADYDAWETLGNPGWSWDGLLPYFKKTENYTNNVDAEFSHELFIQPDPSTHGTDGYVHVSYPRYFYNQSHLFLTGLDELGIPILTDPNNGTASGGMLIPNSISPENQTRSDARLAYVDKFIDTRQNLHLLTGKHVYRLMVDTPQTSLPRSYPNGLWISGVEFVPDGTLSIFNVSCSKEVILAAGAVHTPQILELSGIGDADILQKHNIQVKLNLPGVGNNFQDHPYVGVAYFVSNLNYLTFSMIHSNPSLLSQAEQQYYVNKTGPWTAGAINTVAFPSLPSISKNSTKMMADAASQSASQHLLQNLDPTTLAGYEAQKAILVDLLNRTDVGAYEILTDNIGLLSVSAMHTFSRGSVHIKSENPFIQPEIDPRYCSNPLDCQILVEALLFNNQLLGPVPYYPFLPDATAESLMPAINSGIRTEFHGTGSTSMLPLEHGGVVDPHLRVYGTRNLRIVDAGIIPLVPAAHLQAPVYAIAEKAADIIKIDNIGRTPSGCDSASSFTRIGSILNGTMSGLNISISNLIQQVNVSSLLTAESPAASQTPSSSSSLDQLASVQTGSRSSTPSKITLSNAISEAAAIFFGNPESVLEKVLITGSPVFKLPTVTAAAVSPSTAEREAISNAIGSALNHL